LNIKRVLTDCSQLRGKNITILAVRLRERKVDAGFKVDFSTSEEEKSSTSLENNIYSNDISRRKSIETYRGHNSRQIFSKKQTSG
jgi:hypothetical protein